ncbi:MAG: tyrosine-type recombinase/integrase, partial [Polyangiaceae bacterium]
DSSELAWALTSVTKGAANLTLPVDFHSFRRAFASALAEAGVNVQHAMHLTAHSDPRVHARYVMDTVAMRTIPEAALPPVASRCRQSSRP